MRFIVLFAIIFQFSIHASKKSCGHGLDERIKKIKQLQGQMSQKGIKGELRSFLNKQVDNGVDIDESFIQKISLRHTSGAKYFKNYKTFSEHFDKHGKEFPGFSDKDYLRRAQEIASSRADSILTVKTHQGIFKYIPDSNELLVVEKGVIGTLYRPDLKVINDSFRVRGLPEFDSIFAWLVKSKGSK